MKRDPGRIFCHEMRSTDIRLNCLFRNLYFFQSLFNFLIYIVFIVFHLQANHSIAFPLEKVFFKDTAVILVRNGVSFVTRCRLRVFHASMMRRTSFVRHTEPSGSVEPSFSVSGSVSDSVSFSISFSWRQPGDSRATLSPRHIMSTLVIPLAPSISGFTIQQSLRIYPVEQTTACVLVSEKRDACMW